MTMAQHKPEIALLGHPSMIFSHGKVSLPGKSFLLLTALVAAPRHFLSREHIRRLLWRADEAAKRAGSLRQLLSRFQTSTRGMPAVLRMNADNVELDLDQCTVDLLVLKAEQPLPKEAWPALYGELLEGIELETLEAEELLREFRQRIADWRIRHIEQIIASPVHSNDDRVLLATRLTELDPSNETGWQALMAAEAARGNVSAARKAFLRCKAEIQQEFGVLPDARTEQLAMELGLIGRSANVAERVTGSSEHRATDKPRVVLLPPDTIINDPLLARLGKALLEDITISLSNQKLFKIIAAHTSFELVRGAEGNADLAASVQALDVDYSVYVTLQGEGDEFFATCRLTKVETMEVLWAIDLPLKMEKITTSFHKLGRHICASLTDVIERHEMTTPVEDVNPTAFRLYLEGKKHLAGTELPLLRQARKWFRASIQASDSYSPAHTGFARTLSLEYLIRQMKDQDLLEQAERAAMEALQRDPANGRAFRELGYAALYRRRHDQSLEYYERARQLNPHDADLLADYADALCHDGRFDEALDMMIEAFELNPIPSEHYYWYLGGIHFMRGDYDRAIATLETVRSKPAVARLLAATYAAKGDLESARSFAQIVLENFPDFRTEQLWHFMPDRRPDDTLKLIASLNAAGLR